MKRLWVIYDGRARGCMKKQWYLILRTQNKKQDHCAVIMGIWFVFQKKGDKLVNPEWVFDHSPKFDINDGRKVRKHVN
jgi:hypothetical protein